VVIAFATLVLAVGAFGAAQQVRAYSSTMSTSKAIALTARTPVWAIYVSDLSTFDNFAAMRELVPGSIPYLHGETIAEIPLAFVPRSIWPGKPLGIDFRVSSYLYPGVYVAIPITVQGELYWNGGLLLVAVGAFILGAALGLLARFGLGLRFVAAPFLLYAIALPFTHSLLTRGLATMIQNLTFAIVGVAIAALMALPADARAVRLWLSRARPYPTR
jgi:hypothetical protein